jgi:hypothetical protein
MSEPTIKRKGVLEVETLRRYGRMPAGTRARGWFRLTGPLQDGWYGVRGKFRVGDDPRVVQVYVDFMWDGAPDEKVTRGVMRHGKHEWVKVDLMGNALRTVVESVEGRKTSTGNQRFRVIRAEWSSA